MNRFPAMIKIVMLALAMLIILLSGCTTLQAETAPSINPVSISTETPAESVSISPEALITASATTFTPIPTPVPSFYPKSTQKPPASAKVPATPKATPTPTHTITIEPSPEPTPMPEEFTYMPQSYLQAVCDGVNAKRQNNGEYSTDVKVVLDSGLCARSKAHAMEMAKQGEIYHSCSGAESVAKGVSSNGRSEGGSAAVHCPSLLDPEIVRLGVGAVRTSEGTIYICVVGQK